MRRYLGLILGIVLLWSSSTARAKDNDFQLWTELKISHAFGSSPWTLYWATENRFNNDVSAYMTFNTTLGFDYKILKWLRGGFFVRYEKVSGKDGEVRIFPQFELAKQFGAVELSTRQRFEVRFFPDDTIFRYRSRYRIAFPVKAKPVSFKPYISEEIFVEPGKGDFDQSRFSVGNAFGFLHDKIVFDLYYMLRLSAQADTPAGRDWIQSHILGTSLGFKF